MSREINVQVCSARLLGFSSLSLSTFFLVGVVVRGTCLEQLRVPHTCPHRACPESRGRAWRPGRRPVSTSGPDSVAAFCLKERIPIPVLGDAPGEACPRHRAHHLASGVLGLAPHACAAEGRCVAALRLRDTARHGFASSLGRPALELSILGNSGAFRSGCVLCATRDGEGPPF